VASMYGSKELGQKSEILIIAILLIQLVAIIGAFTMAKLSEIYGNLNVLIAVVFIWILIILYGYYVSWIHASGKDVTVEFLIIACIIGLVMGGIQSLSRSTYSKLMPHTRDTASYFSFYDVSEKIGIVIGLVGFGYIEELTGSIKNSLLLLIIFFATGIIFLFYTRKKYISVNHTS
jgi:MFS transporter, UMF1 family